MFNIVQYHSIFNVFLEFIFGCPSNHLLTICPFQRQKNSRDRSKNNYSTSCWIAMPSSSQRASHQLSIGPLKSRFASVLDCMHCGTAALVTAYWIPPCKPHGGCSTETTRSEERLPRAYTRADICKQRMGQLLGQFIYFFISTKLTSFKFYN